MKKQVTLVLSLLFCGFMFAQKMKVVSGDFDFIKGQKDVNVEFVYDNMKIYKDNKTNEEYMTERSTKLEEKGRGKGKAWEKKWMSSRELIYAPKFLELINKYTEKKRGMFFQEDNTDAKYTLIVETTWLYPGYNVGIMRKPAKVTTLLKFVETANRDNVLLEITGKHAPGDSYGGTFSNEDRIGEGYAKTGKTLAGMIIKKTK